MLVTDARLKAKDLDLRDKAEPLLINCKPDHKNGPKPKNDDVTPSLSDSSLPLPPDGGFGWVVCLASFVTLVIVDGVLFSYGVFFLELLDYFQDSKGKTAFVGSTIMGMSMLAGPVVSGLINAYGCRMVTIMGALIASAAFLSSIFVPNVDILIVTYGIVGGVGFCMMFLSSVIVVGLYFERKRALANSLAMCGSGIGTFLFAPLCTYLQNMYTWRGATMILSALLLNCCVTGALYRPLKLRHGPRRKMEEALTAEETLLEIKETPIANGVMSEHTVKAQSLQDINLRWGFSEKPPYASSKVKSDVTGNMDFRNFGQNFKSKTMLIRQISRSHDPVPQSGAHVQERQLQCHLSSKPLSRSDIFYNGSLHKLPGYSSNRSVTSISGDMLNNDSGNHSDTLKCGPALCEGRCDDCVPGDAKNSLRLLYWFTRSISWPRFWLYVASAVLWTTHSTVLTFIAPYAVDQGFSKEQAALLVSVTGITNIAGRVVAGLLADRPHISCLLLNAASLLLGGVSVATMALSSSFWLLALEAAGFGLCMAHWLTLRPIVLVELLGISNLTNSLGICAMFQGVAYFLGPPLAGLIFDTTGSYVVVFFLAAAVLLTSGLLALSLQWVAPKRPPLVTISTDVVQVDPVHLTKNAA